MVRNVAGKPALVIATPGAEPQADGGYSALVLLDARAATSTLAAREQLVRRWFGAARLVRAGAQVCVVADPGMPEVQALMRWDSRWFAQRELDEPRSIGLPPLTRVAELTGPPDAVVSVDRSIAVGHRTLGPVDVASGTRSYLVVPRAHAQALTRQLADALRSASVGESAVREVRVRMDPRDM